MFPDLQGFDWAKSAIERVGRMKRMIGKTVLGVFGFYPQHAVNRAEMAQILSRTPMTWGEVVRFATPSVCRLDKGSQGTGFVISDKGHIITAAHVIGTKTWMNVTFPDGSTDTADVVATHMSYDIGILKLRTLRPPALSVDDDDKVRMGDQIASLGYPSGSFAVTWGFVEREKTNSDGSFDVATTWGSGNSGGPVLNQCAEVLGVVRYSNGEATNAVYLKKWIEEKTK
jgi:S1-C subfamily serine protease